ncbi:type II secretion system protein [Candidatus Saccharibacteria bacterium]|nr:type II secretion system protein [Candidatus Saccharibacteria bacterium]
MKKGFTIIEVSLVLAIAGLIFLMVFIALPGLRASQRDTSRRENVLSFIENVKKYQNNNRGALPTDTPSNAIVVDWDEEKKDASKIPPDAASWKRFYYDYFDLGKFIDPDGTNYQLVVLNCGSETVDSPCNNTALDSLVSASFPNDYKMYVVKQATCDNDKAARTANPRKIAVLYKLEGAGTYCANT